MQVIIDLDGTLSKYPGSDFRSLYSKYLDFKNIRDVNPVKSTVELMLNRYTFVEIGELKYNISKLHKKYGQLIVLSGNFKEIAIEYLKALGIEECFNLDKSVFREDTLHKESKWPEITAEFKDVLYIDDDNEVIEKLRMMSPNFHYLHIDKWLGEIDLDQNIHLH